MTISLLGLYNELGCIAKGSMIGCWYMDGNWCWSGGSILKRQNIVDIACGIVLACLDLRNIDMVLFVVRIYWTEIKSAGR